MTNQPAIQVVRGNPTDEELAAITAVISAAMSAPSQPTTNKRWDGHEWNKPVRMMRKPVWPSHDGWRHSGLPRW